MPIKILFISLLFPLLFGCSLSCPLIVTSYDKVIRIENHFDEPLFITINYNDEGLEAYKFTGNNKTYLLSNMNNVKVPEKDWLIYGILTGDGASNNSLELADDFILTARLLGGEKHTYTKDQVLSGEFYDGFAYFSYLDANPDTDAPVYLRIAFGKF